ncbi:hypothetical protein [Mucilaginibacter agri]|uniref:Outer membrane protein beta-barrel domain-containing protein n=1 Tax=Mucilaginibacter agri TaxID=2695265 RepID=A0A965ZK89_9SPHI|nr:hypothetical protein [Mucilaginibacter agri]NCD71181.1 hypothetical protein [Mucilaginibacter agri]
MFTKSLIKFFTASVFLLISISSFAQGDGWRIGFGISPGVVPNGPFKYSLGGDIRLQKNFTDRLAGTLSAGFTHFFEKDHFTGYSQYGSPYNVIPVKAGIKAFVTNNFYVGAEAGAGFGFEQWRTSFLWSPSVGLAFNNGLDLSVRYEDFTRSSATRDISLRIAYGLNMRKFGIHKKANVDKSDWKLGLGLNPGISTTDGFVLGGEAGIYKALTSNLEVYGTVGLTHYFSLYHNYYTANGMGYLFGIKKGAENFVPVKVGLRLYAGNQFYVSGDAGAAFASDGNTAFTYSPAIGLTFKNGVDIGAKYDGFAGFYIPGTVSLKLAYRFKL